ncbi:MAG: ADP-ribosylglycohydrolase family protein [Chloroflexota bacterium]
MTILDRTYGCVLGGLIGDAMGTPTEGKEPDDIESTFGWVDDFEGDGTDDSILKYLLCEALIETDGYATADDWAAAWRKNAHLITGPKQNRFFVSVKQTFTKLRVGYLPRMASIGNLPSSSSAMSISPIGIINAGHPRAAAAQAQDLGTLIHTGDVSFCQDGAASIAAAVACAFNPTATLDDVLAAATGYLKPTSGAEVSNLIQKAVILAKETEDYHDFRDAYHQQFRQQITCDTRETVPAVFGLCYLAQGDPEKAITYGSNFGRDTDTIATMAGAICGAFKGGNALPAAWITKAEANADRNQQALAQSLVDVAHKKAQAETTAWQLLMA